MKASVVWNHLYKLMDSWQFLGRRARRRSRHKFRYWMNQLDKIGIKNIEDIPGLSDASLRGARCPKCKGSRRPADFAFISSSSSLIIQDGTREETNFSYTLPCEYRSPLCFHPGDAHVWQDASAPVDI